MTTEGWGEYITHYEDDAYQHHIPCWVNLDEMIAKFPDSNVGEYWEPEMPPNANWNESWGEVEFEDKTYPAVQDWDDDGWAHMENTYGEGNFIEVKILRD